MKDLRFLFLDFRVAIHKEPRNKTPWITSETHCETTWKSLMSLPTSTCSGKLRFNRAETCRRQSSQCGQGVRKDWLPHCTTGKTYHHDRRIPRTDDSPSQPGQRDNHGQYRS